MIYLDNDLEPYLQSAWTDQLPALDPAYLTPASHNCGLDGGIEYFNTVNT